MCGFEIGICDGTPLKAVEDPCETRNPGRDAERMRLRAENTDAQGGRGPLVCSNSYQAASGAATPEIANEQRGHNQTCQREQGVILGSGDVVDVYADEMG